MYVPVPVVSYLYESAATSTLAFFLLAEAVVYRIHQKDVASTWRLFATVLGANLTSILVGGLLRAALPMEFDPKSLLPPPLRSSIGVIFHLVLFFTPLLLSWLCEYATGRALSRWVPMTNLGWCVLIANGVGGIAVVAHIMWLNA